jgi:hypothetical protein
METDMPSLREQSGGPATAGDVRMEDGVSPKDSSACLLSPQKSTANTPG